jgi:GNAT superfamily N-acetyltransferase
MAEEDRSAVMDTMRASFYALGEALGEPGYEPTPREVEWGMYRVGHLIRTDPGGSWVAEAGGLVVGAALGLVREGVWGLSLLVVHPAHQEAGLGGALLDAALAHGRDCRGWIILASSDPRALRLYASRGFDLRPAVGAVGVPEKGALPDPGEVRRGTDDDHELCDRVSRAVRGAAHGSDIAALRATNGTLLVDPGRGFVVHRSGTPKLLAALDSDSAARLASAALRAAPEGAEVDFQPLTAGQDWAVRVALAARLRLRPWGPVFIRGELGPLAPYIPSGSYL